MAMAAAPYLHPKLSAVDAKLSPAAPAPSPDKPTSVVVSFVVFKIKLPTLNPDGTSVKGCIYIYA